MNTILLFGMPGGGELFFIVLIIIMLFGSKKIPELARGLGKGLREIKNATSDIQQEIRESTKDITDITNTVNLKKQVTDMIMKEPTSKPATQNVDKKEPAEKEPAEKEEKAINNSIQRGSSVTPKSNQEPENKEKNESQNLSENS